MAANGLHHRNRQIVLVGSLLFGADPEIIEWVSRRIDGYDGFENAVAIGVVRQGKIICGVVYHNYRQSGPSIEISFAADDPRWATKTNIHHLLAYPFEQLGCERVTGLVLEDNKTAIKFDEGVGFEQEGRIRRAHQGKDILIYGLLREDFFNGKYGSNKKVSDRRSPESKQHCSRSQGMGQKTISTVDQKHAEIWMEGPSNLSH